MNDEINLSNNELTELDESNLNALCELNNIKPEKILSIDLNNNNLKSIKCFTENTVFKNITELYLNNNKNLTDIKCIEYLKSLEELDLSFCKIKNISNLKKLSNLKILKLSGCNNLQNISNLPKNLEDLYINELKIDEDKIIKAVNSLKKLKKLHCYGIFLKTDIRSVFDNKELLIRKI